MGRSDFIKKSTSSWGKIIKPVSRKKGGRFMSPDQKSTKINTNTEKQTKGQRDKDAILKPGRGSEAYLLTGNRRDTHTHTHTHKGTHTHTHTMTHTHTII